MTVLAAGLLVAVAVPTILLYLTVNLVQTLPVPGVPRKRGRR